MSDASLDLDKLKYDAPHMKIWLDYTEPYFSPDSFRVLGWLFMCGAALQRRVWFGSLDYKPMFCNPYILLIGSPATGKGLVQDNVYPMLQVHKDPRRQVKRGEPPADMITTGPDNITYERAVEAMAENIVVRKYTDATGKICDYVSSPIAINLTEIETLFKLHAEAVGSLLRQGYDCVDHKYETKTQGRYHVKATCVSLFAGTQPSRLPKLAKLDAFTDGMASRCIMAFEDYPRHGGFHLGEPTEEVKAQKSILIAHLGRLCNLFGKLQYHKTTYDFLEKYFADRIDPLLRSSDEKLQSFFSRWRANCLKLAAAFHFSESTDYVVSHRAFEHAILLLEYLEARVRISIEGLGKDDSAYTKKAIYDLIASRSEPTPLALIVARFIGDVEKVDDILNMITLLKVAGRVVEPKERMYLKK